MWPQPTTSVLTGAGMMPVLCGGVAVAPQQRNGIMAGRASLSSRLAR
jgi:hypothetical protein